MTMVHSRHSLRHLAWHLFCSHSRRAHGGGGGGMMVVRCRKKHKGKENVVCTR